jgi:hypothetical protein
MGTIGGELQSLGADHQSPLAYRLALGHLLAAIASLP